MIASIVLIVYTSKANQLSTLKVDTIEELKSEWTTKPFVSIEVRKQCEKDEESLFKFIWPGTKHGCHHPSNGFNGEWVDTYEENNAYNSR